MKDELGDRMKSYYENRSKTFLARRTPVIIRLDGKHFTHSQEVLINPLMRLCVMLCRKQ